MICAGAHILSNMPFLLPCHCNGSEAVSKNRTEEEVAMDDTTITELDIDDMIFGFSDGGESER